VSTIPLVHAPTAHLPSPDALHAAMADYRPGHALPRAFYKDPAIFPLDMHRFVLAHWHCVGHSSMAPEPNDFFTVDVAGESVIVARGKDGHLRALLNVCRHRGSRVCTESHGRARGGVFICPYHAWTYDCSGALQTARLAPPDFHKEEHGLKQLPLRVAEGLVFITFAQEPLGFEHVEEVFAASLAHYGWAAAKVAARRMYMIDANWKLVDENYQECYHCGPAHREYSKRHVFARPQEARVDADAVMCERDRELGIALDDIDHFALSARRGQEAADCSRSAMVDGCVTGSEDGRPVAPLMGAFKGKDYDGGFMFVDVGVTTNCVAYPDYGLIYRTVPLTVDKTAFELIWLVDPEAVEGRDYEADKLIWMWDHTSLEDKKIIELNQAGVNSAFFEPGPYTPMEDDAARYIEWYIASMQKA
jgi:phenylpropionate dioxygenase-like ring-hydroxylating dioxygenase large terminal subunit